MWICVRSIAGASPVLCVGRCIRCLRILKRENSEYPSTHGELPWSDTLKTVIHSTPRRFRGRQRAVPKIPPSIMSDSICVAHLVRAKNGLDPLIQFLDSYRKYPAGVDHDLL